jgi:hypothetical protein
MHPGALLPNIGDMKKIRIDSGGGEKISEGGLVHPGRAGSNDDPFQGELLDILFDEILARIRTEVAIIPGDLHSGQVAGESDKLFAIDRGCDIGPAVADIDADVFFHSI